MATSEHRKPRMIGGAMFGDGGQYRYSMWRQWSARLPTICFIMLNPSTTVESPDTDDPTVRRCENYAINWGYGKLYVSNLFAFRSTDPGNLGKVKDPVGPENDKAIIDLHKGADKTICAWGNSAWAHERAPRVRDMLVRIREVYCLGLTADHYPRHPLYCPRNLTPVTF